MRQVWVSAGAAAVLLSACVDGADSQASSSATGRISGTLEATPSPAAPSSDSPSPERTASASPSLGPPLTEVPDAVMLQPGLETTEDTRGVRAWALSWCRPYPSTPEAVAMRTRSFAGPPTTPEVEPLSYTQQVAAFATVRSALRKAFDRMCVYERPDAC